MQGNDWNVLKDNGANCPHGGFTNNVSFSKSSWKDPFDFTPVYDEEGIDYPTYSITLHTVRNGNFKTQSSSASEFFSK